MQARTRLSRAISGASLLDREPENTKLYVYLGERYAIFPDRNSGRLVIAQHVSTGAWQIIDDRDLMESVARFGKHERTVSRDDDLGRILPPAMKPGEGVKRNVFVDAMNPERSRGGGF